MSKYICTADWHLRKSVPICRTETEEEWLNYQFSVLDFIFQTAEKNNASVICAGDLFDKSVPGMTIQNRLVSLLYKYKQIPFYASAGNHDTPYHNFNLIENSGYGNLIASDVLNYNKNIYSHNFNTENQYNSEYIVLCHHLVFPDKQSIPPNTRAYLPYEVLAMYPDAKYIICGDYHNGFIETNDNQVLIVPGCTTIQKADMIDYTPYIYLLDTENEIQEIKLPNDKNFISDTHLQEQITRDERIENFIESLRTGNKISLSFVDNLNEALRQNTVTNDMQNIIQEIREEL